MLGINVCATTLVFGGASPLSDILFIKKLRMFMIGGFSPLFKLRVYELFVFKCILLIERNGWRDMAIYNNTTDVTIAIKCTNDMSIQSQLIISPNSRCTCRWNTHLHYICISINSWAWIMLAYLFTAFRITGPLGGVSNIFEYLYDFIFISLWLLKNKIFE